MSMAENPSQKSLGFWQSMTTQVVPVILTMLLSGMAYVIISLAHQEARITESEHGIARLEGYQTQQDKRIGDLDVAGSRQLPLLQRQIDDGQRNMVRIETKVDALSMKLESELARIQARIEAKIDAINAKLEPASKARP